MIMVDTNLLVYAHRSGCPEHESAKLAIERAAAETNGWGFALLSKDSGATELWTHDAGLLSIDGLAIKDPLSP